MLYDENSNKSQQIFMLFLLLIFYKGQKKHTKKKRTPRIFYSKRKGTEKETILFE